MTHWTSMHLYLRKLRKLLPYPVCPPFNRVGKADKKLVRWDLWWSCQVVSKSVPLHQGGVSTYWPGWSLLCAPLFSIPGICATRRDDRCVLLHESRLQKRAVEGNVSQSCLFMCTITHTLLLCTRTWCPASRLMSLKCDRNTANSSSISMCHVFS